ncbi:MAG: hypothetical protein IT323_07050 [Anaerolineae bacterium]|nr:hypothetical protein [Anaerolineae bacterium]
MKKGARAPEVADESAELKLTTEQLVKLQELIHPERRVDETFDRTRIGAFLLKARLIAPNPDKDPRKAFIVTSEGRQMLKESR